MNNNTINIGTKVLVCLGGRERVFQIVSSEKVNAAGGCISENSPIAKSILGKKIGCVSEVLLPTGKKIDIRVLRIN